MQYCPRCRRTFADGVRFCPSDGAQMSPSGADDRNLGRVLLNQFEILDVCGRGAMGTVYRAHQRTMDRVVAVKVLRRELMQEPDVVRRFVREARAAARLQHPNIVTVHLVGETDDNLPFLVMEYVDGISLESICDGGQPLGLQRACRMVKQIVGALAEAHEQGIIHRDLKPANILVFERGKQTDRVKVLDFGIAKIVEGTGESIITRDGMIFGTPHYLAPEQAQGSAVDARADLYSLGVILFRMTTGRLPFEGAAGMQVVLRHLREPPPSPRTLNPLIPQPLEDLILGCLAKDRNMRPVGAEAVLSDLEWIEESLPPDGTAVDASATSRMKVTAVQPLPSLSAPPTRKLEKTPAAVPRSALASSLPSWARTAIAGGAGAIVVGGAVGIFWARSTPPVEPPKPPVASAPIAKPPVVALLDEHVLHEGDFVVRAGFERPPQAGQTAPLLVVLGGVDGEARVDVTVGALTMNARLDDGRYRASLPMMAGKQRVRVSALARGRVAPLVLAFDVEVAGASNIVTRPQARRARPVSPNDDDLPVTIVEPEKSAPRALPSKSEPHPVPAPVAPAATTTTVAPAEPAAYPTTTTRVVIDKPKPLQPKPEPPAADEPPPSESRPRRPLDDPTTLPPPSPDETK